MAAVHDDRASAWAPPHNADAEASILGGVILRNDVLRELVDIETDDFYDLRHRVVWEAMRNLEAVGTPIDPLTLELEVQREGKLDAVGGIGFFGELALRVPTATNVVAYADEVRTLSRNRAAIVALSDAMQAARAWPHRAEELVDEVTARLTRIGRRAQGTPAPWTVGNGLVDALLERSKDPWVSLRLVDEELCSVRAGGTVVMIGGSGSGKSSLVSCLLVQHARDVGPAIALSIELPAEELAARIIGSKCDASWKDALRAQVAESDMRRVLDLPRLFVLDRRRATIANLERCIDAAREAWPGEPVLVAIDYAQLLDSDRREERQRVADVFARIDDIAREKRVVMIALSQMSRASAQRARTGDAIGAESADLGAESAAIERFATVTLSIGLAAEREDGTSAVELSIGKWRMGKGDRVIPMTYEGRTGRWVVAGDAKTASEVREKRDEEAAAKRERATAAQIVGILAKSERWLSRNEMLELVPGRRKEVLKLIEQAIIAGDVVEVAKRAPSSKRWGLWTAERARSEGLEIVARGGGNE